MDTKSEVATLRKWLWEESREGGYFDSHYPLSADTHSAITVCLQLGGPSTFVTFLWDVEDSECEDSPREAYAIKSWGGESVTEYLDQRFAAELWDSLTREPPTED